MKAPVSSLECQKNSKESQESQKSLDESMTESRRISKTPYQRLDEHRMVNNDEN